MTIDDRLERLAERHEAVAQSLGLLTHDVHELRESAALQGENIERLFKIVTMLTSKAREHEARIGRLEGQAN